MLIILSLSLEHKSAWSEMNFAPLICHTCRVMVGCIPHGHCLHGLIRVGACENIKKKPQISLISPGMSFQYFSNSKSMNSSTLTQFGGCNPFFFVLWISALYGLRLSSYVMPISPLESPSLCVTSNARTVSYWRWRGSRTCSAWWNALGCGPFPPMPRLFPKHMRSSMLKGDERVYYI